MKTNVQIIPGVQFIGWVECKSLPPRVDLHGLTLTPVPILTTVHSIPFFNEPECKCTTEKKSGSCSDTASLKFHSNVKIPLDTNIAFVVGDKNDNYYLIGGKEPPFPTIKCEIDFGDTDGNGAGYRYDISHNAIKTLVRCTI